MKKILATVSAVVLSLAMVAMPSVATADEVESTEPATTEVVATEPAVTEPVVTETAVTEPVEPAVAESTEVATTAGTLELSRQTTAKPTDTGPPAEKTCLDLTAGLGYE
jgi:hypothetical protein